MTLRILAIALLPFFVAGCATAQRSRPLTVQALQRAKVACSAPDAELVSDEQISIVFPGDTPDRERQIQCLFERLRGRGYWFDQIVTEHDDSAGS